MAKKKPTERAWHEIEARERDMRRVFEAQLAEMWGEAVARALSESHGEIKGAAKLLGVTRSRLYLLLSLLEIERPKVHGRGRSSPSNVLKRRREQQERWRRYREEREKRARE